MNEAGGRQPNRAARRRAAAGVLARQAPWRRLLNRYPRMNILSTDEVAAINDASLRILEEIGIAMLLPEARALCRQHGATVDEGTARVRFDRGLVAEALASVPPVFELTAPNPARGVAIGGDNLVFSTVAGPPNCSDLERGRRSGTLADYADFMRLGQAFNAIHLMAGSPVEPQDVPVPIRHLETLKLMLTLTDKVPFVFSQSRRRIADALEMIRIVHGCSLDELARRPVTYTVVNTNSPLQIDVPMLEGIIDLARMGQAVVVTPFTLAGAMAPVTLAGALAQQNAEALAGIAVGQFARPGAPAVYGGFTTNVDMRSGAPTFGTPEYAKAAQISGQLARLNKLPFRSSNICSAVIPDAQAAYESVMATWAAVTGGANILLHGAGWLDGGLTASFEKFVMDIEILQMFAAYLQPEQVDAASLALDTVAEVGPGGHFFGTAHTLARYETAFYQPLLSDWRGHDAWHEAGAVDTTHRAHALYREALRDYEAPAMDAGIVEELEAFVARRKGEGGAPIT